MLPGTVALALRPSEARSVHVFVTSSLTSPRERLIRIGARLVRLGRCTVFQFAETAICRLIDVITPDESANSFTAEGYEPD